MSERDKWSVSIARDGMWPFMWRATIYRNSERAESFDAISIRRAVRRSRRWISRYASIKVEVL